MRAACAEAPCCASPGVRILATSREPLGVPGEVLWRVPLLPAPDLQARPPPERLADFAAVRLFVERARAVHPGFVLTAENAAGRRPHLPPRLDGMPLAIELAAARARVLAVEQIAARLDDRFRLLTGGSRTAPPSSRPCARRWTGATTCSPTPERVLFRRLAVFAGGFTLEAAEQVGAGSAVLPEDVLDLLSQLVDKSLVVAVEDAPGDVPDGGETRYRQLETVRQYAAERLAAADEVAPVTRAHVAAYGALVATAAAALNGPQQGLWLDRLHRDHDNIRAALRAALDGGDVAAALRTAAGLWKFWAVRGHYAEGQHWLDEALLAAAPLPADDPEWRALLARASAAAGNLARARRDYVAARAAHQRALDLWRELDDPAGVAAALAGLGNLASDQGEPEVARPLFEESLELRRGLGDVAGIALLQNSLGSLAYNRRDFPAARAATRRPSPATSSWGTGAASPCSTSHSDRSPAPPVTPRGPSSTGWRGSPASGPSATAGGPRSPSASSAASPSTPATRSAATPTSRSASPSCGPSTIAGISPSPCSARPAPPTAGATGRAPPRSAGRASSSPATAASCATSRPASRPSRACWSKPRPPATSTAWSGAPPCSAPP